MQYFLFTAINRNGEIQSGEMSALDVADLDDQLGRKGLDLLRYRVPLGSRLQTLLNNLQRRPAESRLRLHRKDLIHFTFNLEQLLTAGVPLRDALADFAEGGADRTQQQTRRVTLRLIELIDSGRQLSDACSTMPAVFSPLYCSMVAVGEQTGRLAEVMCDLGALLRWNDETISRMQRVLIYPAFVSLVLLLVIVFVMTWLVPGLMSFLISTGGELPWHSQALIGLSDFVVAHGLTLLLIVIVAVTTACASVRRSDTLAFQWHRTLLRMPLIGSVLFHIKLARFSRCAALMYSAGISLLDALKHCEQVLDNRLLAMEIAAIRQRISEGYAVSECFASSKVFPPMVARMVRVGESTGAMENSFQQISYLYDRQSAESIETLEQSIGPALIMVVGSIMLWVVVSVIGPIYDLVFSMGASF